MGSQSLCFASVGRVSETPRQKASGVSGGLSGVITTGACTVLGWALACWSSRFIYLHDIYTYIYIYGWIWINVISKWIFKLLDKVKLVRGQSPFAVADHEFPRFPGHWRGSRLPHYCMLMLLKPHRWNQNICIDYIYIYVHTNYIDGFGPPFHG